MAQYQHRLWHAVSSGDLRRAMELLKKKNVEFCLWIDDAPSFPLNVAVKRNHYAMVRLLLERGVNPRISPSPILVAMEHNASIDVVELLLHYGADPNFLMKRWREESLLYEFCKYPHRYFKDVGELLLDYGADPFFARHDYKTCLYVAAQNGNFVAVDVLLDHAERNGYITDLLAQNKRDTRTNPFLKACCKQHHRIVEHLLEHGANVNTQNVYGMFPLYVAVSNNDMTLLHLLLRYDADVTMVNPRTNRNVVDLAFDHGFYEMAIFLEGQM